jgi:hypothetical protein
MSRERDAHRRRREERWDGSEYESGYQQDEEYEDELPRRRIPQRRPYPRSVRVSTRSPVTRSPHSPPSRSSRIQSRQPSAWPALLTGCAIGVILAVVALATIIVTGIYSLQNGKISLPMITPANRTISTQETLTVPLSSISQIVVCDVIGNVLLKADPTVSKPTVTVTKNVQASSQTAADQQFQHLVATIQPPGTLSGPLSCTRLQATAIASTTTPSQPLSTSDPSSSTATTSNTNTTLTVNVTMPAGSSAASVDMTIALPPNVLPASGPSTIVSIETAGNISVDGLSGLLNIKSDSGNPQNNNEIQVTHAALADGSRLSTSGAISFDGYLAQAADPNKTAFYILEGEKQIDVTLPGTINVTLEAYAVSGSINSQFPLQPNLLQKDKNMTSYHGPLNASVGPPVNAQLTLHVGIGSVNIHQAQNPAV